MLFRQKPARDKPILAVRDLTREDLPLLREKRNVTPAVVRLRDTHHRVARLVATGLRLTEVAEQSGYSYNRVQSLSVDPAFQELVATYRAQVTAAFVEGVDEFYDLATKNMRMAERMLADKMEAADFVDETLPTKDLIAISEGRMDRFGYGKKNTTVNVNADFASQLEAMIRRSGKAPTDITPTPAASPPLQPAGPAQPKLAPLVETESDQLPRRRA